MTLRETLIAPYADAFAVYEDEPLPPDPLDFGALAAWYPRLPDGIAPVTRETLLAANKALGANRRRAWAWLHNTLADLLDRTADALGQTPEALITDLVPDEGRRDSLRAHLRASQELRAFLTPAADSFGFALIKGSGSYPDGLRMLADNLAERETTDPLVFAPAVLGECLRLVAKKHAVAITDPSVPSAHYYAALDVLDRTHSRFSREDGFSHVELGVEAMKDLYRRTAGSGADEDYHTLMYRLLTASSIVKRIDERSTGLPKSARTTPAFIEAENNRIAHYRARRFLSIIGASPSQNAEARRTARLRDDARRFGAALPEETHEALRHAADVLLDGNEPLTVMVRRAFAVTGKLSFMLIGRKLDVCASVSDAAHRPKEQDDMLAQSLIAASLLGARLWHRAAEDAVHPNIPDRSSVCVPPTTLEAERMRAVLAAWEA